MRRIPLLLAAALLTSGSWAQQLPQLSQYTSHDYLYNPAVAGSREWFELRSAHRNQWVGVQDAPRTFMLSLTTPVGRNMGLGGFLYTDHVGPTRRTGAQFSYAYHLRLTERIRLGFGLSLGLQQFLIDGSKITFHDGYDPILDAQLRGSTVPDATFALYLYHENWWFGASAPQLLKNKIVYFDDRDATLSALASHYFAMGGYRIHLSDDLRLEPSFLVKYVAPVPVKIDLTATLRFKEQVWLGATYRTQDALSFMVGYWLKKTFQFGYSYDAIATNLNRYSSGTHEVMLGITFGKKRPAASTKVPAPSSPEPASTP
jgi:type IX secretion system PorP/SprF family membrane protein